MESFFTERRVSSLYTFQVRFLELSESKMPLPVITVLVRLIPVLLSAALRAAPPVVGKIFETKDDKKYADALKRAAMPHREAMAKNLVDLEKDDMKNIHNQLMKDSSLKMLEILGTYPSFFNYKTQEVAVLFIRDAMTLVVYNLTLLTTTEDQSDRKYTMFYNSFLALVKKREEIYDIVPDFVEKISDMLGSSAFSAVRTYEPGGDVKRVLSPKEKEMLRYILSQKVTGVIQELAELYNSVLYGNDK